jgi:hypothetical protein
MRSAQSGVVRRGNGLFAVSLLVATLAGCGATSGTSGANSSQSGTTTTAPVSQATMPVVRPPAGEAGYKATANAVTIDELVNGRVNAPSFSIGTIVTFAGVIQSVLSDSSGRATGLIVDDTTSSATICVQLSARASALKESRVHFLNAKDMVTVWGAWRGPASVVNFPHGSTAYPAVTIEMYLTDTTTGQSDDEN